MMLLGKESFSKICRMYAEDKVPQLDLGVGGAADVADDKVVVCPSGLCRVSGSFENEMVDSNIGYLHGHVEFP
jgi:hypothetical protein